MQVSAESRFCVHFSLYFLSRVRFSVISLELLFAPRGTLRMNLRRRYASPSDGLISPATFQLRQLRLRGRDKRYVGSDLLALRPALSSPLARHLRSPLTHPVSPRAIVTPQAAAEREALWRRVAAVASARAAAAAAAAWCSAPVLPDDGVDAAGGAAGVGCGVRQCGKFCACSSAEEARGAAHEEPSGCDALAHVASPAESPHAWPPPSDGAGSSVRRRAPPPRSLPSAALTRCSSLALALSLLTNTQGPHRGNGGSHHRSAAVSLAGCLLILLRRFVVVYDPAAAADAAARAAGRGKRRSEVALACPLDAQHPETRQHAVARKVVREWRRCALRSQAARAHTAHQHAAAPRVRRGRRGEDAALLLPWGAQRRRCVEVEVALKGVDPQAGAQTLWDPGAHAALEGALASPLIEHAERRATGARRDSDACVMRVGGGTCRGVQCAWRAKEAVGGAVSIYLYNELLNNSARARQWCQVYSPSPSTRQ